MFAVDVEVAVNKVVEYIFGRRCRIFPSRKGWVDGQVDMKDEAISLKSIA